MLLSIILGIHLTLVLAVVSGFVYRYFLAFKYKDYPKTGRNALLAGAGGLVISGSLLAVIGKLPISSLCLESLGLIVALLAIELILQKLSSRLATEKNHLDK